MDTDDLSINTYDAVIMEAERFHHDLTLQFGLLASRANSDNAYLDVAEEMIGHWKTKLGSIRLAGSRYVFLG